MAVVEVPLVPPARLAALLSSTRSQAGLDLTALARRSNGVFSPTDLEAFERGRRPLDETTIDSLIDLYQLDAGPIVPGRNELVLDLTNQSMQVGEWTTAFDSPLIDDVLERYVALVHLMRGHAGTRSLTLRTGDLDVLSRSLQQPPTTIRARIEALVESQTLPTRRRVLQSMTAVAGAGILVGVTVVGAVVFVNAPPDPASDPVAAVSAGSVAPVVALSADVRSSRTAAVPDQPAPVEAAQSAVELSAVDLSRAVGDEPATDLVLSERAQSIEALIDWDFRQDLAGWRVIHGGPHVQWRGVTNSQERVITLFDRPDSDINESAAVLAHELGHAVDLEFLNDEVRTEWLAMRGTTGPWWAGDGQRDFAVGAGDFAEAVAAVLVGTPSRSDFGPFTADQLGFVRDLLPHLSGVDQSS